jgi:hypothetical protein
MLMSLKIDSKKISQLVVYSVVLIYGLLMAEYYNTVNIRIATIQGLLIDSIGTKYMTVINFVIVVVVAIVVWQASSFLFHMFSILFGGDASFRDFQKYSGLVYAIPALGFLASILLFETITIPEDNVAEFMSSNKSISIISWIINISSTLCFVLLVPVVKYLYQINWLRAFGAIVIPIGSIYLLGQFFGNYVL